MKPLEILIIGITTMIFYYIINYYWKDAHLNGYNVLVIFLLITNPYRGYKIEKIERDIKNKVEKDENK